MFARIVFLLATLVLAGCTNPKIERESVFIFVEPPVSTYSETVPPRPLSMQQYLQASPEGREDMCLDNIEAHQTAYFELFNARSKLSLWVTEQRAIKNKTKMEDSK